MRYELIKLLSALLEEGYIISFRVTKSKIYVAIKNDRRYGTIQICVNKLDIKTVSLYMGHSTIETTLRIYTHPEQLDRETFLNGSLKEEERLEILRKEYAEILAIIEDFLK